MTSSPSLIELSEQADPALVVTVAHRASGLRAFVVLDDLTLGPAVGGIRTQFYASEEAALADALGLARSMTYKCALGGVPAGGGKTVVIDHPGLDRRQAFRRLGEAIDDLGGRYLAAGDLGTTPEDLAAAEEATPHVYTEVEGLAACVGRGVLACIRAAARRRGRDASGLSAVVQGCGAIGTGVARALADVGVKLLVADVDASRAEALASDVGGRAVPPETALMQEVDVLVPCATGGVITAAVAERLQAWLVCGGANRIMSSSQTGEMLVRRGITVVPDIISSSGAVVAGVAERLMGVTDPGLLIDGLGLIATRVLDAAEASGAPPSEVAVDQARRMIALRRAGRVHVGAGPAITSEVVAHGVGSSCSSVAYDVSVQ